MGWRDALLQRGGGAGDGIQQRRLPPHRPACGRIDEIRVHLGGATVRHSHHRHRRRERAAVSVHAVHIT